MVESNFRFSIDPFVHWRDITIHDLVSCSGYTSGSNITTVSCDCISSADLNFTSIGRRGQPISSGFGE